MDKRQNKIITPVDFSPASLAAVKAGAWFAKLHSSELILLFVLEHAGGILRDEPAETRRIKAAEEQLGKIIATLARDGVNASLMIEHGKPYKAILKTSEEIRSEMIVMGSFGDESREYGLLGSNTTRVVRAATCPVLSVRDPLESFNGKKILMPVDTKFGIRELRSYLQTYHKAYQPEVLLVNVVKPRQSDHELVRDHMKHQVEMLHKQGIANVKTHLIEDSDITEALLNYAQEEKVDMIWMETHGREGMANLVLGSVTEEVLNQSMIPVLSLHPVRRELHTHYSAPNLPV